MAVPSADPVRDVAGLGGRVLSGAVTGGVLGWSLSWLGLVRVRARPAIVIGAWAGTYVRLADELRRRGA